MRRVPRNAWLMSVWLMCVAMIYALVVSVAPAHALAASRTACGGSSSASSGAIQAKGSARISLNTTRGVAGTQVVVSGTGWPVGQHIFISVENLTDDQGGVNGTGWLQLPAALEFKVDVAAPLLHYTGPFVDHARRPHVEFPWHRLDRRPLVYASLGTLQNGAEDIFRKIAQACVGLDLQLVISLGGGLDPASLGTLPGDPLVVRYAPQLEIVKRAAAVITHAGLNTTLESLAEGVPLVCIPLGNDQPGVAARVAAQGAGVVISRRKLTAMRLRSAIEAVLSRPHYRAAACRLQDAIRRIDGLDEAANIIETALKIELSAPAR